jgi:hypothetical protein
MKNVHLVSAVDMHQTAYTYTSMLVMHSLHTLSRCCANNIYLVWVTLVGMLDVVVGTVVLEAIGVVPITTSSSS